GEVRSLPRPRCASIERSFMPGSRWLTAKLYCGPGLADRVLLELVEPWIERARQQQVERWHFLRYGDPHWHLRVRVEGEPALLYGPLLAELHAGVERCRARGLVWRMQLDSYEREVERYGGPDAIELVERIFEADSEAVLANLVRVQHGGEELRWQLLVRGIDQLLDDLGLALADKLALVEQMRASYGRELGADRGELRHQLGRSFRRHRATIERLLA